MKYILTVEEREIINYIDSIVSVNEGFDSIVDKCNKVIDKIKNLSTASKRKILIYFITSLLTIASADKIISVFHDTKDPVAISVVDEKFKLHNPLTMKISQKGISHIKVTEGKPGSNGDPVLSAYSIGDGKITVGWGHAEDIGDSDLKIGEKISLKKANSLLNKDIKFAEDAIKRIFKSWKENGIIRKLTQDQYDVIVSMTFNMGIGSMRKSEFIQHLKRGEFKKAGDIIKVTNIDPNYPGLAKRRLMESSLFLSYLNQGQ